MPTKPNLPPGYLGPQPTFSELGLNTFSHMDPEITVDTNEFEIKLKMGASSKVKITHQLINCRTEEDVSGYVFTTTVFGCITFKMNLPSSDYYKFQLFGLPSDDSKGSLPNIYNYLILCNQALCQAFPFPKQYAKWTDGCVLKKPTSLHEGVSMSCIPFHVNVPDANAVAVVADGEWFHLEKKGNHWEGDVDLSKFKGNNTKVTLNANTDPKDDSKYSTLLEYRV